MFACGDTQRVDDAYQEGVTAGGVGMKGWLDNLDDRVRRRISSVETVAAAVAVIVCAALITHAFLAQRPVDGAGSLLLIGIPVLALGQIWAILLAWERMAPRTRKRGRLGLAPTLKLNIITGDAPRWATVLAACGFVGGWLVAMTSFGLLTHGNTTAPTGWCSYLLNNHGALTCVTPTEYAHVGAGEQRFVGGILLSFFSFHALAAFADLSPSRQNGRVGP